LILIFLEKEKVIAFMEKPFSIKNLNIRVFNN